MTTIQRPPAPTGATGLPTGEVVAEPVGPQTAESVIDSQFAGVIEPSPQANLSDQPAPAPAAPPHPQRLVDPGQAPQPQIVNNGRIVTTETIPQPQVDPNQPLPITSAQQLGFAPREVVVGQVQQAARIQGQETCIIRVTENVDNMTITSSNLGMRVYNFTAGHEYEVPVEVAKELGRCGRLFGPLRPPRPTR